MTDEHIIPRGLNGTILLPKSTCKGHQELTSGIELALQKKGMFLHPRLLLGMRSYNKKRQPTHIKIEFIAADNRTFKKNVPVQEAASVLVMPMFLQSRVMTVDQPLPQTNALEIQAIDSAPVGREMRSFLQRHRAIGLRGRQTIDINSFLRYLCKIAYGSHFVTRGKIAREESPALSLLLGDRQDFGNWVGCVPLEEPMQLSTDWHQVSIADMETKTGVPCAVVRVSLFNFLVPCTYTVVTHCHDYRAMVTG
ncbi:hypothetical protein WQ53_05480 [Pseudoxanthomonas suwonensis]|uniref:Uncharacterized protein n=1 Tax=Pseudoxanthomonas suwonensis TaxID=314722 RepID=A0A0E3Z042_9GAMM|nr:hypothetical protein WQ53_05480 [Pseudoxanthomonas suwonensis]